MICNHACSFQQWSVELVETFTSFMETFVAILPKQIYSGHGCIPENPLPNTKDPCSHLHFSCAEGKAWLDWEQVAFKCKPITSAVEGGRVGIQVTEDVLKGGNLWCIGKFSCVIHSFCPPCHFSFHLSLCRFTCTLLGTH